MFLKVKSNVFLKKKAAASEYYSFLINYFTHDWSKQIYIIMRYHERIYFILQDLFLF